MIIHSNNKPIRIIGFKQSTSVQEVMLFIIKHEPAEIISPEEFELLENKEQFQYIVPYFLDINLRQKVINIIEDNKLNCPSYVDDTCILWAPAEDIVGYGCVLSQHVLVYTNSRIGNYCSIETFSLIGHYTRLGDSVHTHPGVMIAGKVTIGNNCTFGMRSTVLDGLTISNNTFVSAGALVSKDLQSGRYAGSPARRIGNFNV